MGLCDPYSYLYRLSTNERVIKVNIEFNGNTYVITEPEAGKYLIQLLIDEKTFPVSFEEAKSVLYYYLYEM